MSFGVEVGIGERVGRREGGGGGDVEFVAKLIPTIFYLKLKTKKRQKNKCTKAAYCLTRLFISE